MGPVTISDDLTTAMKHPRLYTLAYDIGRSFKDHHPDVLMSASPPKALCLKGKVRHWSVTATIIFVVMVALVVGTAAGGLPVGFGAAVTVGIVASPFYWWFK